MKVSKDELVQKIELTREKLNKSIDLKEKYEEIYRYSVELDRLIELYIVAGF